MGAMAFLSRAVPHRSELLALLGAGTHVLCWAAGPDDSVLAATSTSLAAYQGGRWEAWGWHQIVRGGWSGDKSALTWATVHDEYLCQLDSPGELPGVFRDRIQASTAMTVTHDLDRGSVQLVARRSLDDDAEITWMASASGGASLDDPATAAFVVEQTDLLRAEYGL